VSELNSILYTAGGLGLFLLGMVLMTEYLKKLAANRIRSALFTYTKTPYSGALTGAVTTAVVQSSSVYCLKLGSRSVFLNIETNGSFVIGYEYLPGLVSSLIIISIGSC